VRNAIAWFTLGIWKLRGLRRGVEVGRCHVYEEEENESHILLKCKETKTWREQFFNNKWLQLNE
jgi:hypothetical protein